MTPESRKDRVLTQSVGDELVVYDERHHEAHRLNKTAAHVFRLADGQRSLPDLATSLREALASETDRASVAVEESEELVRLALEELNQAGLLVGSIPSVTGAMTRRQMLVIAAALLPVVASIVAPTPAMAQSYTTTISLPLPPTTTSTPLPTTTTTIPGNITPLIPRQ